jgi:DNA repair protein RadC
METNRSIKCWAEDDRPREKMILKGKSVLSDAELIAILLGTGTHTRSAVDIAKDLLQKSENNLLQLGKLSLHDLQQIKGIGMAKAVTLSAAIELGKRRYSTNSKEKQRIISSKSAFDLLSFDLQDLIHEEFFALYLNRGNCVIQKKRLSVGGTAGTVVDGKILYKTAIELNAAAIILAHNHPSGRLKPSESDIKITKNLVEFGKFIEIDILDHLIITDAGYYSFADEGIL